MRENYLNIFDFDTKLFAASTTCTRNFIIAKHIASGREMEFKNVTAFKGKKKLTVEGDCWLANKNIEMEAAGKSPFPLDAFEITHHSVDRGDDKMSETSKLTWLQNAKNSLTASITHMMNKSWVKDLKLIIGGKGNYREHIAFTQSYKNTRPEKPHRFLELSQWLFKEYGHMVVAHDGIEADDVLGVYGTWGYRRSVDSGDPDDNHIVLTHIDKDINQVPGWHFNPSNGDTDPHWITETSAARQFWLQMLHGDSTDCIPGLPEVTLLQKTMFRMKGQKVGPSNARLILKGTEESEVAMARTVLFVYKEYYEAAPFKLETEERDENGEPIFIEKTWIDMVNEQFGLLRLQEKKDTIPTIEAYAERVGIDLGEI
ncbi:MAG: hypothetical protein KAJ19_17230 [Gammaproteobacteria bacterium]|nr:hypothetical protein [Gammaproteobacteria bacterium]